MPQISMPQIVDSHCHLDFPDFADDLDGVVARAQAAGVARMVTICTRLRAIAPVRAIAERHAPVFFAAGKAPAIGYVDTPEAIRGQYQYFTEAKMARLRALGYGAPFYSLEDGVADYVGGYLAQADPYR